MNVLLLILKIGAILISAAPELYKLFMEIMAAIPPTHELGNATSEAVVKSTARAIIPVLDGATAAKLQATIDSYEQGDIEYELTVNTP